MSKHIDSGLCVRCQGVHLFCKKPVCPILARFKTWRSVTVKVPGTSFFGATPPEVLVGSRFWPRIYVGPLVSPVGSSEVLKLSDPTLLFGKPLEEVISLRAQLIRSRFRIHVREARKPGRLLELTKELSISSEPVDAEVRLSKPIKPSLRFDGILAPAGPSGEMVDLKIVGNPVVPRRVDQIIDDYDVRAVTAIQELYDRGISTYYISRLLSIGSLGRAKDRLLVPSRWSITAVDASVANHLREKIVDYEELGEIQAFSTTYVGNRYEVVLLPGPLAFEMIEIWNPGSVWTKGAKKAFVSSDHETWRGRTTFSKVGGGYYAMKLPVYEYLHRIRRQAFVLAIREVTPEYWVCIGSWKIREALRAAFREQKPKKFDTAEEALADAASRLLTPFEQWFRRAKLLRQHLHQTGLEGFFRSSS